MLGGYAGQINLGHAAFFGLGALVTRLLWVGGTPLILALMAGAVVATAFACLIGVAGVPSARRLLRHRHPRSGRDICASRSAIFCPQISTIRASELASYDILPRYYLTLALAIAVRRRGRAAGAFPTWASAFARCARTKRRRKPPASAPCAHKLLALAVSTALAGLAGGAFAYYHVSYYPQHAFSPAWTFDAVLMSFIGGVGTVHGPVLGALFYVILKEILAVQWVEFHLIVFGVLFILVVLFFPGGLVEAWQRASRVFVRHRRM